MIAAVIPTIRPTKIRDFLSRWREQFDKHFVVPYFVIDGDSPTVWKSDSDTTWQLKEVMGKYDHLIYNFNDGVRNLGFAKAIQDGADVIVSLDDDVSPFEDTIGHHLQTLYNSYSLSWMNTADQLYMRGIPYNTRKESECVLSHGVWLGMADLDAETQLKHGTPEVTFPVITVPRGTLFPICAMNFAFKREFAPYIYQAPMYGDINRFADIWGGIEAKKDADRMGKAMVTGRARVIHARASNPIENLKKEKRGREMNEEYGKDPYFKMFAKKRKEWKEFIEQYL